MCQDNTLFRPVGDFSSLVFENLLSVTGGLGKIVLTGLKGALGHALSGLVCGSLFYMTVNLFGSGGDGSPEVQLLGWLSFVYLVTVGILCGLTVGFIRGLKKGIRDALLQNENTYRLFENILNACFEQIDRDVSGGNPITELKNQFDEWSRKLQESDRGNFPSSSKKIIARLQSRLEGIVIDRLAGSLKTINAEIEMYKLDYSEREETVKNLTRLCWEKTDTALDKSIDRLFFNPLLFAYTACFVLLVLPVFIFWLF